MDILIQKGTIVRIPNLKAVVEAAVVHSHRPRNSHRDIAVQCGLRFDPEDDAAFFGEEKRRTVRKVEEHILD